MALSEITIDAAWGKGCHVCQLLNGILDEASAARLEEWLHNPRIKYSEIEEKIQGDPDTPNVDAFTLSRHARGHCDLHKVYRPGSR